MKLTDEKFWNDYWGQIELPCIINKSFSFERCLAHEFKKHLSGCTGEILEIGCAPGKWLHFFSSELNLKPSGIDYSTRGTGLTKKNLAILDVKLGDIWVGDFLSIPPVKLFDVVISLGFIEHFSNQDEIIKRHLDWLKPGGKLVLGIPNFQGIYLPIQEILDKSILDKHNTSIMSLNYFNNIAEKFCLTIHSLGYVCSFEPTLPIPSQNQTNLTQKAVRLLLYMMRYIRALNIWDKINSPFFSSYILAIYKNRG